MRDARVIVIGGGYSGAMTAAQLASRGVATVVIEPGALGRGVAYAATSHPLLLNVRSAQMSALPDAPDHFEAWLDRRGARDDALELRPAAGSRVTASGSGVLAIGDPGYAPRALYGDYIADTVVELAGDRLEVVRARATSLEQTSIGFVVACDDGRQLAASNVVLALGHAPPRTPRAVAALGGAGLAGYLTDPLRALAAVEAYDDVAILGTGLTALDVISGLRAQGHRGRIICASRRGLLPLADVAGDALELHVPRTLVRQPQLRELLRWWRGRLDRTCPPGDPAVLERAMVAALQPVLSTIWRRLAGADRARFLRHLRPRWDVLRHRAPPSVRGAADRGIAEGAIEVMAAQLGSVDVVGAGLRCRFAAADGSAPVREVRWLVNCTGPERDVRRLESPLVRSLLERRLIAPDPLGLGVLTAPDGQLIGERGPVPGAFVVGPWRMADLFEATLVPELRQHAVDTAQAIAGAPSEALLSIAAGGGATEALLAIA